MIQFKYGTQAQYDASSKQEGVLYFIEDTKRIYRGSKLVSGVESLVVTELPLFEDAIDGVLYIIFDSGDPKIFIKGEHEMKPVEAKVAEGSIDNVNVFADEVLLTSEESFEISDVSDGQIPTAKAVRQAIDDALPEWEEI